ncbi:hypothetical protein LJK87_41665 [Paenibacillus sp. P25]|nr:hypothetical protein LJK87_41665 [Paenibacillus sp. P25]
MMNKRAAMAIALALCVCIYGWEGASSAVASAEADTTKPSANTITLFEDTTLLGGVGERSGPWAPKRLRYFKPASEESDMAKGIWCRIT